MKKMPVICLIGLLSVIIVAFGCSRFPTEDDFRNWLQVVYEHETGLQADEITICSWERIPDEVLRMAPDVDGLKVQAAIFTFPLAENIPAEDYAKQTTIHYVYCNYYKISDEWYLHASSWGGGFWKQDPAEWSHLVDKCRVKVEELKGISGMHLPDGGVSDFGGKP